MLSYAWHLKNTGQTTFSRTPGTVGVDINVESVIESGITGEGVTIAVSDDGIEISHEDLFANYVPNISENFLDGSSDPLPNPKDPDAAHGTAVTGIIAAMADNALGSRGVAPSAKFGGYNYIAAGTGQTIDQQLTQMTGPFDIFNYSYGYSTCRQSPLADTPSEELMIVDRFVYGVTSLREGKGAIYVKSAGNDYRGKFEYEEKYVGHPCYFRWPQGLVGSVKNFYYGNATLSEANNYPYTIIAGAINAKGKRSSYSSPGPNVWVSAPGGEYGRDNPAIVTTDLSGCDKGYSLFPLTPFWNIFEDGDSFLNPECNYTSAMNGTSSAAPIVSGVTALILEANPQLGWRDVKHILAKTARKIDPVADGETCPYSAHPHGRDLTGHTYRECWVENAAGYSFHNYYGFGLVDAAAAVKEAQSYSLGELGDFFQTDFYYTGLNDEGVTIPDNSATGLESSLTVSHNFVVEAVQIRVTILHSYAENLGLELTSPSGTKSIILNINSGILDRHFVGVKNCVKIEGSELYECDIFPEEGPLFLANAFYGEDSQGAWTLKIIDGAETNLDGTTEGGEGKLHDWRINIFGHKPVSPDDTTPPEPVTNLAIDTDTIPDSLKGVEAIPDWDATPSTSDDVLRYEYSIGSSAGETDILGWGTSIYVEADVPADSGFEHHKTDPGFFQLVLEADETYHLNVRVVDTSENVSTVETISWVHTPPTAPAPASN